MVSINDISEDFSCKILPLTDTATSIGFVAGLVGVAGGVLYGLYSVVQPKQADVCITPGINPICIDSRIVEILKGIGVSIFGYAMASGSSHAKLDLLDEKVACGYVKPNTEIYKKLQRQAAQDRNMFIHQPREVVVRNERYGKY